MLIAINDSVHINPDYVAATCIDTRHFMNGSESVLRITMADGKVHIVEAGRGVDIWALRDKILNAGEQG